MDCDRGDTRVTGTKFFEYLYGKRLHIDAGGEKKEKVKEGGAAPSLLPVPPGALQEVEWVVRQEPWAHLPLEDWVDLPQLQLQEEWGGAFLPSTVKCEIQ